LARTAFTVVLRSTNAVVSDGDGRTVLVTVSVGMAVRSWTLLGCSDNSVDGAKLAAIFSGELDSATGLRAGVRVGSSAGSGDGICGVGLLVRAEVGFVDGPRVAYGTIAGPVLGISDTLRLGNRVSYDASVDGAVGSADSVVPILGAMKLGGADLTGCCEL